MYGYLGPMKPNNFYVNIQCITHREKPWILNSFTGLTCAMPRILGRTSHDVPAVEEIWRFFGRQLHESSRYRPPLSNSRTGLSVTLAFWIAVAVRVIGGNS